MSTHAPRHLSGNARVNCVVADPVAQVKAPMLLALLAFTIVSQTRWRARWRADRRQDGKTA